MRRHQPNFKQVFSYFQDPKKFLQRMDEENVERACLINYVAPDVMGFTPGVNPWIHKYAKADRSRLVPFGGIHPGYVKNAKKEVEELLSKYEVGGVKVHPPHSLYYPNDYQLGKGALKVLYERCEAEGVPVMFHTGTSIFPGARNKYGDPIHLDDVLVDYPKLKVVMAHGGRPMWMQTALFLLRRRDRVWMDLSSIPPKKLLEYFPRLEDLSDRVLFGSDWPGPNVPSMRSNADAVAALPLSTAAKRRILYENASRLLR